MKGDYQNGKIYKIQPNCDHEDSEIYFGSTTQLLCKRMGKHRTNYKLWKNGKHGKLTVFNLFDKYGLDNCKIYLVEDYPCERKEQLEKREGEIIKTNKCVNKVIAGRSRKQYKIDNKNKIQKYGKEYKLKNKDKIAEKNKKKYNCECGSCFRYIDKAQHEKSLKHKKYQKRIDDLKELNKMHNEIIKKHKQLYF